MARMNSTTTRVPHPRDGFIVARLGIALRATALLCTAFTLPAAHAQSAPCGISSLQIVKDPIYPPLARAAHFSGTVILMATFAPSGSVTDVRILHGPEILKASAKAAVMTWIADPYTGPRECPIVIDFKLVLPADVCDTTATPDPAFTSTDKQHFTAQSGVFALCDPAMTLTTKRHRFLIF
jgi:TonB family protein